MLTNDKTDSGIPLPLQINRAEDNLEIIRSALVLLDARSQSQSGGGVTDPTEPTPVSGRTYGVIHLEDELDSIHGIGGWSYHTVQTQGTDIGAAIISACEKLRSESGRGTIKVGAGQFFIATPIPADKLSGITISGAGSMATVLNCGVTTGALFGFSGAGGYTGGGVSGMGILLIAGLGDTNAVAIKAEGDASFQPDQLRFSDLYITAQAGSYWFDGMRIHGNARTSPQGIRNTNIESVQVFCCKNTGVWLSNVVQLVGSNIGVYVGVGTGQNIYVAGGGQSNTNSIQVYLNGITCSEFNVTNTSRLSATGTAATFNTNTTFNNGDVTLYTANQLGSVSSSVRFRS